MGVSFGRPDGEPVVFDNVLWGHQHPDVRVRGLASEVEQLRDQVQRMTLQVLALELAAYGPPPPLPESEDVGEWDPVQDAP